MKYVKYVILVLFISLVTGCTAEYNVKIGSKFIEEELYSNNFDKSSWDVNNDQFFNMTYKEYIDYTSTVNEPVYFSTDLYVSEKVEGIDYYDIKLVNNSDNYGLKYSFKHKNSNYKDSRILNFCYDEIEINDKNNRYDITTSKNFNCFEYYEMLDEVTVNITTSWNYSVISSNADKVENGKYTWIITKDNSSNKPIRIELKKVFNWKLTLVILIPTLVIATISYFIIKKKVAKNNQI